MRKVHEAPWKAIPFFLIATAACLPSLALLLWLRRRSEGAVPPGTVPAQ
jgi:hypothetical protein